jgi:anti-sigma regulatory factor (Ser/Thr protein kinase)
MRVYAADAPDPREVAEARHAVSAWLRKAGVGIVDASAILVVTSELVTNSIRHARSAFELSVELVDDAVRIEVFDRDTRIPVVQDADGSATGGRGMHIVATLAEQWGVQTEERNGIEGKSVWASMPLGRTDD